METLRKTWNQNNQPTLNQKFRSTTKKQSESCKEVPNQQHAQQLKVAELEIATLNPPVLSSEIWVPFCYQKLTVLDLKVGGSLGSPRRGRYQLRDHNEKNALKVYMDCPHIKHPCLGIMIDVCFFSCCFFRPSHIYLKNMEQWWKRRSKSPITSW